MALRPALPGVLAWRLPLQRPTASSPGLCPKLFLTLPRLPPGPFKGLFPVPGPFQASVGWPSLGAWPQKLIVPVCAASNGLTACPSLEFWLSTFPCRVQWPFLPRALPQAFSYASETAAWPLQRLISRPWAFPGISWLVAAASKAYSSLPCPMAFWPALPWSSGLAPSPASSSGLSSPRLCPKFFLTLPRLPPGPVPSMALRPALPWSSGLAPRPVAFPPGLCPKLFLTLPRHQLACGCPSLGAWPLQKLIAPFPAASNGLTACPSLGFWLGTFLARPVPFPPKLCPKLFLTLPRLPPGPFKGLFPVPGPFQASVGWAPGRFKSLLQRPMALRPALLWGSGLALSPAASSGLSSPRLCPKLFLTLPRLPPGPFKGLFPVPGPFQGALPLQKLIVPFPAASNGLMACPSLEFWLGTFPCRVQWPFLPGLCPKLFLTLPRLPPGPFGLFPVPEPFQASVGLRLAFPGRLAASKAYSSLPCSVQWPYGLPFPGVLAWHLPLPRPVAFPPGALPQLFLTLPRLPPGPFKGLFPVPGPFQASVGLWLAFPGRLAASKAYSSLPCSVPRLFKLQSSGPGLASPHKP